MTVFSNSVTTTASGQKTWSRKQVSSKNLCPKITLLIIYILSAWIQNRTKMVESGTIASMLTRISKEILSSTAALKFYLKAQILWKSVNIRKLAKSVYSWIKINFNHTTKPSGNY